MHWAYKDRMPALAFFTKVAKFAGIKGTFITFPMIKKKAKHIA